MTITLNGTGTVTGANTLTNTNTVTSATATALTLQSAGTTAITVDTSQNVGIGTTSPTVYGTYKTLEVKGTGGGVVQFGTGSTTAAYVYSDGTNSGFNNLVSGYMNFATAGTERMRIDSSGNLLVGTTSYGGATNVAGFGANPVGQIAVERNGGAAGVFNRFTSDGNLVIFRRQGTTVGSIDVTATATSYVTSSDYRLKEDIAPMTGALATVQSLKPVTYKWKSTGENGQGFIAHELQTVVPDAVTGEKDAVDIEGNPHYQGIDTSFLVATLTAAIQELNAKFEEYKATHP